MKGLCSSVFAAAFAVVLASCGDTAAPNSSQPAESASAASTSSSGPLPTETAKLAAPASLVGGSVARSPSGDALYVAHEDLGVVRRLALPSLAQGAAFTLPGAPAQVLALDGKLLVTVRDPGLLMTLTIGADGALSEASRVALPADAWGLAVTPDQRLALVTSAWTHRVSAVELASGNVLWSVEVAREPRAVVVRADGKGAYVTHLTRSTLTRIDGLDGAQPTVREVPFPAAPLRTQARYAEMATLAYGATLSPRGDRLFVPRQALGAKGLEVWSGYATVDVLLTGDDSSLAAPSKQLAPMWTEDFQERFGGEFAYRFLLTDPTITGAAPTQKGIVFTQPRAVSYRASKQTLLIASEGQDTLVELDAAAIDPSLGALRTYDLGAWDEKTIKTRCGAPSGVALSADEATAYVFCRSTMSLAKVALDPLEAVGGAPPALAAVEVVSLADEPLAPAAALGRTLFYNSRDNVMSAGFGCAACHPEGRDDGHVWHMEEKQDEKTGEVTFERMHAVEIGNTYTTLFGVPRQTPMLAGRIAARGPYGWKAESPSLKHRALVGFGIHRWFGWEVDAPARLARVEPLLAFLAVGLKTPPVDRAPLTDEEQAGKKLFSDPAVGCATCHVPETEYTNRAAYDLGKLPLPKDRFSAEIDWKFKTPSLLFIGGTAPYLHDGGVPTLEALIDQNGDRMGHTKQLNPEQKKALVAFLKRL